MKSLRRDMIIAFRSPLWSSIDMKLSEEMWDEIFSELRKELEFTLMHETYTCLQISTYDGLGIDLHRELVDELQ